MVLFNLFLIFNVLCIYNIVKKDKDGNNYPKRLLHTLSF